VRRPNSNLSRGVLYAISRMADCPIVARETRGALTLIRAVCFSVLAAHSTIAGGGFELAFFQFAGPLQLILQVLSVILPVYSA
jgi:hypothetical protein